MIDVTLPRFLQIHTLHSYPAALLNRDDTGLAKRMPFGGAARTRVSSQSRKRRWRMAKDRYSVQNIEGAEDSVRSRNMIDRAVIEPMREKSAASEEILSVVAAQFNIGIYGSGGESENSRQMLLFGLPEVEYLREKAAEICAAHPQDIDAAETAAKSLFATRGGEGANFAAFRANATLPGGLIGAMFGRMVTSDVAANIDAPIHVAHAFTVHGEEVENDFFTALDDLRRDDEQGGIGHIGDSELNACLLYGYVVVDIPGLVSNLTGCAADEWTDAPADGKQLASKTIEHLAHLIATITPGAKKGSTAPYAFADLMLIEAGSRQPRSLANAYRAPIPPRVDAASAALFNYLDKYDDAYGAREDRRFMAIEDCEETSAKRVDMDELARWAGHWASGGQRLAHAEFKAAPAAADAAQERV